MRDSDTWTEEELAFFRTLDTPMKVPDAASRECVRAHMRACVRAETHVRGRVCVRACACVRVCVTLDISIKVQDYIDSIPMNQEVLSLATFPLAPCPMRPLERFKRAKRSRIQRELLGW